MILQQAAAESQFARPVVLGGGVAGLAISRALSQAGVSHVLIGDPPNAAPRLGESLNAEGSLEIARQFPELSQYLFDKQRVALFYGGQALAFDSPQMSAARAYYPLMGYPETVRLLHVERVGFDRALFALAQAEKNCVFINGRAASIEYNAGSDRVAAVTLAGGERVAASYVFDCTNNATLLARKIGVRRQVIGAPRRVVFAHYGAADAAKEPDSQAAVKPGWMQATSLLRLERPAQSVDGVAWCIPLGSYVSIGVSVDPSATKINASALLDAVDKAYAQVGIDIRAAFPTRMAPTDVRYEHYTHERCFGRNWLLVAAACCQIWFPSAAGVATGLVAARLAPNLLRGPLLWGRVYQGMLDQTAASHAMLDWLAADSPRTMTRAEISRQGAAMVRGNATRLVSYLDLKPRPAELAFGDALGRFYAADRRLESPLRTEFVRLEAQAGRVFAPFGEPDPWSDPAISVALAVQPDKFDGPRAILAVIDELSGKAPAQADGDLMNSDLKLVIDSFELSGVAQWSAWVKFLRGAGVADLVFVAASLAETTPGTGRWTLAGQWRGTKFGRLSVAPEISISFALAGDKITLIETKRADYTFVCGDQILPRVAFAAMLAEIVAGAETNSTAEAVAVAA